MKSLIGCFLLLYFQVLYPSFVNWMDIPKADYQLILQLPEAESRLLNREIVNYHLIDKSCRSGLPQRISALEAISHLLMVWMKQDMFADQRNALLLLNKAVVGKRNYLAQLMAMPSDEEIAAHHLSWSKTFDSDRYAPLFLRNDLSYSLKMQEFWGGFWLETVDPCHRRLAPYYQLWLDTGPRVVDYGSFFLWLESQLVLQNIPVVDYFSDEQVEACRIEVVNGYLRNPQTGMLVSTESSQRNLFIIDLNYNLYLRAFKNGVWHNSLSRGRPVLGAGLLQVERGLVRRVSFESGHYLPSLAQGYQTIQILIDKGVRFATPLEIIYFENRIKYKALVSVEEITSYDTFNTAIHDISRRETVSSNEF